MTIEKSGNGYVLTSGQQDAHLVITRVAGGIRFYDTRSEEVRGIPDTCHRAKAALGKAVVCDVPDSVDAANPMTLQIVPRLGDDYTNGRSLNAAFELYVLADRGRDTTYGGAGDDFINSAQQDDMAWGGAGDDWIRGNKGVDQIWGGPGNDRLVGVEGRDVIRGGPGDDRVGGGPGDDLLYADSGQDFVVCGTGNDLAHADSDDSTTNDCESIDVN